MASSSSSTSTSTISEPILVSSYPCASGRKRTHGLVPHASVAHSASASKADEGLATVTIDHDGIHIVDLSTLHAIASHTLGPDTSFACPAATRSDPKGKGKSVRQTYAAIESAPDLEPGTEGRTLWAWTTSFEGATETPSPEKTTFVYGDRISAVHTSLRLPLFVILVFAQGDVALASGETLDISAQGMHDNTRCGRILKTFVLPGLASAELSAECDGAVVITALARGDEGTVCVKISAFGASGELVSSSSGVIELGDVTATDFLDISFDASGSFSILTKEMQWTLYQVSRSSDGSLSATPSAPLLPLNPARFVTSTSQSPTTNSIAILHLNTSLVLLAALSKSSELQIMIWDLNYQALLASFSMPLPSSSRPRTSELPTLQLVRATPTGILVSTSPSSSALQNSTDTPASVILMVPISVPPASSIFAALGRAVAGEQWMLPATAESTTVTTLISQEEQATLKSMTEAAAQVSLQEADGMFDKFVRTHQNTSDEFIGAACRLLIAPSRQSHTRLKSFEACFKKNVLHQTHAGGEHGLIGFFLECGDWSYVMAALMLFPDIPEDTLAKVLQAVVRSHMAEHSHSVELPTTRTKLLIPKIKPIHDVGQMNFDEQKTPPPLVEFVIRFLRLPTSPGVLRAALRKHLKVEEATAVLVVLERVLEHEMAASWGAWNGSGSSTKRERRNRNREKVPSSASGNGMEQQLTEAIALVQNILDAFLLLLLQYPPAHPTLEAIMSHLKRETALQQSIADDLRGPLSLFAQVDAESQKPKLSVAVAGERKQALKQRRDARAAREAQVAPYQIETITF